MVSQRGVISYPVPLYQNVPIHSEYYIPSRFVISAITLGQTTTVTTSTAHDYVIGQQVRLIIPVRYGSYQLNEAFGYVISIPTTSSVVVNIISAKVDAFIANPYTATITNITKATNAVITANNNLTGTSIIISGVSGMPQINGLVGLVVARSATSITVNINSSGFTTYGSGGVATLYNVPQDQAQIMAIGDVNTGAVNSQGRINNSTFIPGSFIDISPL